MKKMRRLGTRHIRIKNDCVLLAVNPQNVSGEKDTAVWQSEFAKLVEGLPDDTLLTVVDCHT